MKDLWIYLIMFFHNQKGYLQNTYQMWIDSRLYGLTKETPKGPYFYGQISL